MAGYVTKTSQCYNYVKDKRFMIQRIQTVYLLLIVALMTAGLFLPLSVLQLNDTLYSFDVMGVKTMLSETPELVYPAWELFALCAVIILLALITIFFYRKRILQIRLCIFNGLLLIGFYVLFIFFIVTMKKSLGDFSITGKIALTFPFVCLIFDYLAIRNIGADEALVRSLDRLR